jgi:hypothetical protein
MTVYASIYLEHEVVLAMLAIGLGWYALPCEYILMQYYNQIMLIRHLFAINLPSRSDPAAP